MNALRKLILLILICLTVVPAHAQDDSEIRVGLLASLSGNWSSLGDMTKKGAMLAVEYVNAGSGVLGKKIKLVLQDTDESVSAAKVITAYRNLRYQGIALFIGPTGSPGGIAIAPIARQEPVIMISPSVGIRDFHEAGDNLFNSQGVWESASSKLAQFAIEMGTQNIAVLASEQPFEMKQGDAFQKEFEKLGGKVVSRVNTIPDKTDLRSELLSILARKPAAVFFANYNQMGLSARQLRELGFKGKQYAALIDDSRLTDAQGALEGTIFTRISGSSSKLFTEQFKAKYGQEPSYPADFTYDAVTALVSALNAANSLDVNLVKNSLKDVTFEGASGKIKFDLNGCVVRKPSAWRVVNGKFELVKQVL
jgi:branched-chain amino acid transport system substrate-binding protein